MRQAYDYWQDQPGIPLFQCMTSTKTKATTFMWYNATTSETNGLCGNFTVDLFLYQKTKNWSRPFPLNFLPNIKTPDPLSFTFWLALVCELIENLRANICWLEQQLSATWHRTVPHWLHSYKSVLRWVIRMPRNYPGLFWKQPLQTPPTEIKVKECLPYQVTQIQIP